MLLFKKILISLFLSLFYHGNADNHAVQAELPVVKTLPDVSDEMMSAYRQAGLSGKLEYAIFARAYKGMQGIKGVRKKVLAIADFSRPSTARRFFIVDLSRNTLLFETWVAHGQGSGQLNATRFSNVEDSHQSSLGFYLTGVTYEGAHGYSLRLKGLEKNINDNAESRTIVMHGADYVSQEVIRNTGRLGRSWGCPAVAPAVHKPLINAIKDGAVLYIHAADKEYQRLSKMG